MQNTAPRILVTNDDGVHSPGLLAAVEAVASFADVTIAAPLTQQTGMGRAQCGNPKSRFEKIPLVIQGKAFEGFACDAAPARVVSHFLSVFPQYRPDLLISGINYGENFGITITGSGTVGAAMEGAAAGIPSIAVSLGAPVHTHYSHTERNWQTAIHFLGYFTKLALANGFPDGADILKIEIPEKATPETDWRVVRLSRSRYYTRLFDKPTIDTLLGDGKSAIRPSPNEPADTDRYTTSVDGLVSLTPLRLDSTAHEAMEALEKWR